MCDALVTRLHLGQGAGLRICKGPTLLPPLPVLLLAHVGCGGGFAAGGLLVELLPWIP